MASSQSEYGSFRPAIDKTERTALLRDTIKLTDQTNDLATEISGTLYGQRASLEDGSSRIKEMKGFAGEARRTLNKMARRAAFHRMILWIIIVILLLLIGLTLYRLFTNHGHII